MTTVQKTWSKGLFQKLQQLHDQRHLYSIRTTFTSLMPVMIVGAYAVVLNNFPIAAVQQFLWEMFGPGWKNFGVLIYNSTTQIAALMVVFGICMHLAQWYNANRNKQIHGGICGMVGLASYVVVSLQVEGADSLPFSITGVTGLFVAILVSVLAGELFIHLSNPKSPGAFLSDDPSMAVPQAFSSIVPALVVVFLFAFFRMILVAMGYIQGLPDMVNDLLRMPYLNSENSFGTAVFYNLSTHFMWLLGIHGNNVLDGVATGVFVPAMAENMAAVAAGAAPPNLVTKTLFDTFVYMGGSGTTLGLLLALMVFGRDRSYRRLMRFALPNSIFNINEPLVFGIPIVLNPVYAIPFVITPVVMFLTTALTMKVGMVPYTSYEVSWATPVFISGYLATGSMAGVILQVFNLALAVLIYMPFVRLSERLSQMRFQNAYSELARVVTTEYSPASKGLVYRVDEVGAVARHLASQLEEAMDHGEMYLHYQPIVDAQVCRLHSVEALLRWDHPQHGLINPMVVVALAEETGKIDRLGLWIMDQALRQRMEWTEEGLQDFHVSVNVSCDQLQAPDFYLKVMDLLRRRRVPPQQLQVEITETTALVENETTRNNLINLHEAGSTIAMDDFGVGHSSLLYLRTMPIDTLKIDGSLSREVLKHPANLGIISTIYDLCRLMKVETIIEYVDNQAQLDKLMGVGEFLIQGYLYSPPLPSNEIAGFMQKLECDYPL